MSLYKHIEAAIEAYHKEGETNMSDFNALNKQVGGSYYKHHVIQPVEFITKNNLTFLQGCIIKRICRYNKRNFKMGLEDLEKIKHEVDLIIELEEGWKKEWESQNISSP